MTSKNRDRPPRKYQAIWRRIKKKETCSITCHENSIQTIKRGVIKEKTGDTGFKIMQELEKFTLVTKIEHHPESQTATITFSLKARFGLEDMVK